LALNFIPHADFTRLNSWDSSRYHGMITLLVGVLRDLLRPNRDLIVENLALRQQLLVRERNNPRPPLTERDRAFWVLLSHWWPQWRQPLRLVQPETVIAWHRRMWRYWWRWKSQPNVGGRPRVFVVAFWVKPKAPIATGLEVNWPDGVLSRDRP
jgi:hypothetical protein